MCGTNNEWPSSSAFCNGLCTRGVNGLPAYCPAAGGMACATCAQTTCAPSRTACLADPTCASVFEGCLVSQGCYDSSVSMFTCLHSTATPASCGTTYSGSAVANAYHNCLTHSPPPFGCSSASLCY